MKELIIKINPNGSKVDINAEGFVGGECSDVTKKIADALGTVSDEGKKAEYYETVGSGTQIHV